MRIQPRQQELLREERRRAFRQTCVRVIARHFPDQVRFTGLDVLRRAVDEGLAAARAQGLSRRDHTLHLVVLRLWLGHRFQEDPGLPLSPPMLPQVPAAEIGAHLRRVEAEALAFLARVDGSNGSRRARVLLRFRDASLEEALPAPSAGQNTAVYVAARLRWWHPSRCDAMGDARLTRLAQTAVEDMRAREQSDARLAALHAALMLLLGRGVLSDPWHSWVHRAMEEALGMPSHAGRAERLAVALQEHVRREV